MIGIMIGTFIGLLIGSTIGVVIERYRRSKSYKLNNDPTITFETKYQTYVNNKLFWVPAFDLKCTETNETLFTQYTNTPCIFCVRENNKYSMFIFDEEIDNDHYKYTAWRKVIGQHCENKHVEVLLWHAQTESFYLLINSTNQATFISFNNIDLSQYIVTSRILGVIGCDA